MDCQNISTVKFLPWLRPYSRKPPKLLFRMFLAVLKSSKKFHKKDWKLLYDQWRSFAWKHKHTSYTTGPNYPRWSICWFPAPNSSPAGKQLRKWEWMFRKMRRQDAPARRSGGADRYTPLSPSGKPEAHSSESERGAAGISWPDRCAGSIRSVEGRVLREKREAATSGGFGSRDHYNYESPGWFSGFRNKFVLNK